MKLVRTTLVVFLLLALALPRPRPHLTRALPTKLPAAKIAWTVAPHRACRMSRKRLHSSRLLPLASSLRQELGRDRSAKASSSCDAGLLAVSDTL